MISKEPIPPPTQRVFANSWAELAYLCKKTRYWLYVRGKKSRAGRYLNRLREVLNDLPENDVAIIREEGYAILRQLENDLNDAIVHRQREIALMERLHEIAEVEQLDRSVRNYMLQDRGKSELNSRRTILKRLEEAKKESDSLLASQSNGFVAQPLDQRRK